MQERVEHILETEVRPFLATHGGDVELVEVDDENIVKVRLTGACGGCPLAQMTLTGMVEKVIKSQIPEIKRIEAI
ncbi:MAG: NifU family protein [bacterium]|nr:NifU family protein [bacterium]